MRRVGLAVLLLAGCQLAPTTSTDGGAQDGGAPDAGTGSLSGALAFTVHQSFEVHLLDQQNNVLGYGADIVDYDNTCAQLEGGTKPTQFQQVEVGVLGSQANATPPPGTFQIMATAPASGFGAYVKWARLLEDGGVVGPFFAQDGTVTLGSASAERLSGTFQVDIPDANGQVGPLQGIFDAPYCP